MLDVHPPHSAVHGWRDFLIHIATITLGLLIAISLEGALEAMHHRHLVREARENIRKELEGNETESAKDAGYVQQDADNMKHNAQLARAYLTDPKALDQQKMSFTFTWNSLSESAWRSARDSGALTYMPLTEVQGYADIYEQQEIVDREAVDIFTHQPDLAAGMMFIDQPGSMTADETRTLLHGSETTYFRLLTLKQLVEQLHTMTGEALKKKLKSQVMQPSAIHSRCRAFAPLELP